MFWSKFTQIKLIASLSIKLFKLYIGINEWSPSGYMKYSLLKVMNAIRYFQVHTLWCLESSTHYTQPLYEAVTFIIHWWKADLTWESISFSINLLSIHIGTTNQLDTKANALFISKLSVSEQARLCVLQTRLKIIHRTYPQRQPYEYREGQLMGLCVKRHTSLKIKSLFTINHTSLIFNTSEICRRH